MRIVNLSFIQQWHINCEVCLLIFTFKITNMIRKLKSGEYRLYSRKKDSRTNKRKNLGTFRSLEAAKKHEWDVQYFKHH
jgi:hypothetical protein